MSAELASYGGAVAAGHGALGLEPPLSPPNVGSNGNSMTTNSHGYLGLVPGDDGDQPDAAAAPVVTMPLGPPSAEPAPAALESLLLRFGLVSSDQLGEALREHAETGRPIGAVVVERGWVSAADVERLTGGAVTPVVEPAPSPVPAPAAFPAVPEFAELPEPPAPVFHVVEPVAEAPEPPVFGVASVAPALVTEAAEPEPEPVLPPVAPIVPFQGTFTPLDEDEADPEPAAVPFEPQLVPVTPVAPVVAMPPVASAPPVAPAHEPAPFTVEAEPTPPAVPLPARAASSPHQPSVKHLVIARLTTGERVEVNSYADRNAARAEAKALMAYLREGHKDWPFVNGRFIRPESIVSIDLETVLLG